MTKKNSTPRSFKQYDLPKTLLIGVVAGVLAATSNGVSASCESEVETCRSSCHNSYAELTTACAEERSRKYDDCGSFWAQIFMDREERDQCRRMAQIEYEGCIEEAWRFRDRCMSGCDENLEACSG
jgi:hypothetical protein